MDHSRLITTIIDKYAAYPAIQADFRRVLKYVESQSRMFLTPLFKANTAVSAIFDKYADRPGFAQCDEVIRRAITDPADRQAHVAELRAILVAITDPADRNAACDACDQLIDAYAASAMEAAQ